MISHGRIAILSTCVVVAGLALSGTPAEAAPVSAAAVAATNVGSPTLSNKLSAANYWTPERMASATPVDLPADAGVPTVLPRPAGKPTQVDGVLPKGFKTQDASIHTMSGRVFFVDDRGTNHSCSGSTVNSNGKRLVFTAGHCVHGGGSGRTWFDVNRWVFVPEYHAGSPFGTWNAYQLWTKNAWINNGNRAYDVAAVVMQDKNGQHIVDAVGGQGIKWNAGYGRTEYMFGYPADPPYDGSKLYYCYGTTANDGGFPMLGCNMTGGASGGPWLDNYGATFWAYVNGVNSWMFWHTSESVDVYKWQSPYFSDDTAGSLFNQVQNM